MIDQGPLYNSLNFSLGSYNNADFENKLGNVRVPAYFCPSSSKERDEGDATKYTTHYYGNMGPKGTNTTTGVAYVCKGQIGAANDDECLAGTAQGGYAKNGPLGQSSSTSFRDFSDGTSNTLLVGEISNHKVGNNANAVHFRRWYRGAEGGASAGAKNILHGINAETYTGGTNFNDVSFGSNHEGGTHFVMGDGAVKFISENVNLDLYKASASMNGGEAKVIE
jgi:hypothetical protein